MNAEMKVKKSKKPISLNKNSVDEKNSNALPDSITQQEHQKKIQELAYYIAERRGFSHGNPTDDWLVAEKELAAQFSITADPSSTSDV